MIETPPRARFVTSREVCRRIGEARIAARRLGRGGGDRLAALEAARFALRVHPGRPKRLQESLVGHVLLKEYRLQHAGRCAEGAREIAGLAEALGLPWGEHLAHVG